MSWNAKQSHLPHHITINIKVLFRGFKGKQLKQEAIDALVVMSWNAKQSHLPHHITINAKVLFRGFRSNQLKIGGCLIANSICHFI